MRYVIDIDGTICTPGPTEEMRYEQAMPIRDRISKINKLYDEGHTIVYLTARGMGRYNNNTDLAKKEFYEFTEIQLSLWECKYHQLFLFSLVRCCSIMERLIVLKVQKTLF